MTVPVLAQFQPGLELATAYWVVPSAKHAKSYSPSLLDNDAAERIVSAHR